MAEEQLTIFCDGCGTINEQATETVNRVLAAKNETITDLNVELAKKLKTIREMKAEQVGGRENDPLYRECVQIFDYWRASCRPGAREFNDKRWNAVHARLNAGHSVATIKRAIDGVARKPYVTDNGRQPNGRKNQRFDDLELICRDEEKLERFVAEAEVGEILRSRADREIYTAAEVEEMQHRLKPAYGRLHELRGWSAEVIEELGLGLIDGRVGFFAYDAEGALTGVSKYQPNKRRRGSLPKNIAEGARELWPRPEDFDTSSIWLVEGEPDAIAMRTIKFPAVAVPGVNTWKDGWARRFEDFERVYVCFDCDKQGREAAEIRTGQIGNVTRAQNVDLADRDDGYDINDLLIEFGPEQAAAKLSAAAASAPAGVTPILSREDYDPRTAMERIVDALERLDCNPRGPDHKKETLCPNHDDRRPSMTVTEGDDRRVLLHCHAGCEPSEVVEALGLDWKDLFARDVA